MRNKIIEHLNNKYEISIDEIDFQEIKNEVIERLEQGALISFSQNYEDIILKRIFNNFSDGVFVDVGAYHPFYNSNTYLLYSLGWRGINIDMDIDNMFQFSKLRNKDINITVPISDTDKEIETYMIKNSSRSSIFKEIAEINLKKDESIVKVIQKSKKLNTVLEENKIDSIDLLSIDVEGAEVKVLNGFDLLKYSPSVIILEAIYPQTSEIKSNEPEKLLNQSEYFSFYFDGINKFFCSKDNLSKYKEAVKLPPNYFDNFIRFKDVLGFIGK